MSKNNVVPISSNAGLPAHLLEEMERDAGKGLSQRAEDNIVPLINVLQALSPQVDRRGGSHIEGAEPGAIWLKSAPIPILSGETGLLFQPCHSLTRFAEWVPRDRGGGFVGRHRDMPADAREVEKNRWVIESSGNEIRETKYVSGHALLPGYNFMGYVIPFSSTGLTVAKTWMFKANNVRLPSGGRAPIYSRLYVLRTRQMTNNRGTWFSFEPELVNGVVEDPENGHRWTNDKGWVSDDALYFAGRALQEAVEAGEKDFEEEGLEQETAPRHSGDDVSKPF